MTPDILGHDPHCPYKGTTSIEPCFVCKAIRAAVEEEREACAILAEDPYGDAVEVIGREEPMSVGIKIAAAIHARGKK